MPEKITLDQALQKGMEAHKAGKLQEADRFYTAILTASPKHPEANHNMGVLAVGCGKVEDALKFFKTALEINPNMGQFWLSYINALIKLNRIDEANQVLQQAENTGAKITEIEQIKKSLVKHKKGKAVKAKFKNSQDPSDNEIVPIVNLYSKGQYREAQIQACRLLKRFPKSVNLLNVLGASYQSLGEIDAAISSYKQAITIKPNIAEVYNNMGNALKVQGKLDEAIEAFKKAHSIKPNSAETFFNIGNVLKDLGNFKQSIQAFKKALELKPDYAKAYNNMGVTFKAEGKLDEAIEAFKKALSVEPNYSDAYNNMGNVLKDQRKLEEAVEAYKKAVKIKAEYAEAFNNMGIALKASGRLEEAVEAYKKAVKIKPEYAEVYNNMGIALHDLGKLEEAIQAYNRAIKIKPDYPDAYNNMGGTLKDQGNLNEAIEIYYKALSIKSDYAFAHLNIGITLQDQDKREAAANALNKALSLKPDCAEAHRNLSLIQNYTLDDKHFLKAQELYGQNGLTENQLCSLNFALAKMYEDVGELKKAFQHLSEGNALRKKQLKYSIEIDKNLFNKLKVSQLNLLGNTLKINEDPSRLSPIFIIGMPRSGTTLIEQIISSHSKVTGAGELRYVSQYGQKLATHPDTINRKTVYDFRNQYLSELSKISNGRSFVTDKMPQNFLYIPLICSAFPEAKLIHVKRNAAAVCWSNYKQYFTSQNLGYCYNLKDIVEYYKLYEAHFKWCQNKYSKQLYNINYEQLTTDQEYETRKLIEYLDLKLEDACLAPHKNKRIVRTASQQQVRKKIYQGSSEAWKKYKPYLDGAFDGLF